MSLTCFHLNTTGMQQKRSHVFTVLFTAASFMVAKVSCSFQYSLPKGEIYLCLNIELPCSEEHQIQRDVKISGHKDREAR